jgi:hypothetical protein
MKPIVALILLLSLANLTQAQDTTINSHWFKKKPLSPQAFRKMMRDYYSFTVVGNNTPATGFKVETAKPSITLKGNIYNSRYKKLIVNLELTGGFNENNMNIFSSKKLDGYFKTSLGVNYQLRYNKGAYDIDKPSKVLLLKSVWQNRETVARQLDTLIVLQFIIKNVLAKDLSLDNIAAAMVIERNDQRYIMSSYEERKEVTIPYMKQLSVSIFKKYYTRPDTTWSDDQLYAAFWRCMKSLDCTNVNVRKLVDDQNALNKINEEDDYLDEKQWSYEIDAFKSSWAAKRITWVNVTATAANNTFRMYDAATLIDTSSFLPGLNVSVNFLRKWKEAYRFVYWRAGATVQRTNSTVDLPKMDYKKEEIIQVTATEKLVKEKTGTAYIGQLAHSESYSLYVEGYLQPWTNEYFPGLYGKLEYRHADVWITMNKVALDLGIIWNVTNGDKDAKNILSIVPYVNWSNIAKEYKRADKLELKKGSDVFSFGVKLGVPINLGK